MNKALERSVSSAGNRACGCAAPVALRSYALATALSIGAVADCAAEVFMRVEGLKVSAGSGGYWDWIRIASVDAGVARAAADRAPSIEQLSVGFPGDAEAAFFLKEALVGSKGRRVEIEFAQNVLGEMVPYSRLVLRDSLFTGFALTGSDFDGVSQKLSLAFSQLEFSTLPGIGENLTRTVTWDLVSETGTYQTTSETSPPVISSISDRILSEDGSSVVGFSIWDAQTAASALSVSVSASDAALFPTGSLVLAGGTGSRSLTLKPAPDATGSATITLTVSDGALSADRSFQVTVNPINDAPTLVYNGPAVIETVSGQPVTLLGLTLSDIDAGAGSLRLSAAQPQSHATWTLSGAGVSVSGAGTPSLAATGTLPALQAALEGETPLVLTPNAGYPVTGVAEAPLTLELSDLGNTGSGGARTSSLALTLRVIASLREKWRSEAFSAAILNDPAAEAMVWGDEADPDGDQVPNLLEFAFGMDATNPGRPPIQNLEGELAPPGRMAYFFPIRNDPRLTWKLEVSENLAAGWRDATPADWETVSDSPDGEFRYITVLETAESAARSGRFVRISVQYQ